MQHVFIVGSKGIPGAYGGYETFVDKLTEYHQQNTAIKYHVACRDANEEEFEYHNARCFKVKVPNLGSAQAVLYDVKAILSCCNYIQKHDIQAPIIYILACRIGPFMGWLKRKIKKLGGTVYVNPDGHEWLRAKWSAPIRKYWKISERLMVKHGDLIICDNTYIETYIQQEYSQYRPNTTFIPYGSEVRKSVLGDEDPDFLSWMGGNGLVPGEYYLVVGRLVPENNFEIMLREFLKSDTKKTLALITTPNGPMADELEGKLHYKSDERIKFLDSVYNKELLMKIRENAYAYLHGHEVGGTNPSLLEALGSTRLNLVLGVNFNREVADDAAFYWGKEPGELASLIAKVDGLEQKLVDAYGKRAKERIAAAYSWPYISAEYEKVFYRKTQER